MFGLPRFINQNTNWRWTYWVIVIWAGVELALLILVRLFRPSRHHCLTLEVQSSWFLKRTPQRLNPVKPEDCGNRLGTTDTIVDWTGMTRVSYGLSRLAVRSHSVRGLSQGALIASHLT